MTPNVLISMQQALGTRLWTDRHLIALRICNAGFQDCGVFIRIAWLRYSARSVSIV